MTDREFSAALADAADRKIPIRTLRRLAEDDARRTETAPADGMQEEVGPMNDSRNSHLPTIDDIISVIYGPKAHNLGNFDKENATRISRQLLKLVSTSNENMLETLRFQRDEARAREIHLRSLLKWAGESLRPFANESTLWGVATNDQIIVTGDGTIEATPAMFSVGDLRTAYVVAAEIEKALSKLR